MIARHVPRTRPAAIAVLLLVVALVLAGCSSSGGNTGGNNAANGQPGTSGTSGPPAGSGGGTGTVHAVGTNPLGAKWDWSRVDSFAPYLRQISGGATFYELVWCDVEPKQGQWDWSTVDRVASQSRQLGFSLYLKIRTGACWATGGPGQFVRGAKKKSESAMPVDMNAYRDFVRAAVTRYKAYGVHEYAVENEVNGQSMWAGSPDDYIKLTTVASQAIRVADPKAVVVDAGISSTAYGEGIAARLLAEGKGDQAVQAYQSYYERRFSSRGKELPEVHSVAELQSALQGAQAQRNLSYLAAVKKLAEQHVVDVRQIHFYEKWSNVPALLDYLHAETPKGTPIEAWEVGNFWPDGSGDENVRAAEMVKTVTGLVAGGVRRVIWLPLAYDPGGRHPDEVRYGLLDPNGGVREAGKMLLALAQVFHASTARAVHTGDIEGAAFEHGASSTLVVWTASGNTALSTSAVPGVRTGSVGGSLQPAGSNLQLGQSPLVVRVDRPLDQALRVLG